MNRFINTIVFVLLVTGGVTIFIVAYDLEISTGYRGSKLPYKEEIFLIYTVLMGFLLFGRSLMRWFTLQKMNTFDKVLFEAPIARSRKRLNTLFLYVEAIYMLVFGIFFQWVSPLIFWCGWILIVAFLDTILFYFVTIPGNKARIILTPKAVAIFERQLELIPLANMKEADIHFDQVFIHYKKGFSFQFSLGGISKEELPVFKEQFFNILEEKKVFISDALKDYTGE